MTEAQARVQAAISKPEFIALIAMMFATIAFSIDAMLPALPEIGHELSPDDLNKAQLVLTSFVLGMGIGTFFTGPLSDAFGRKSVMVAGSALYILAAFVAWMSTTLEVVLIARVVQGVAAAAPRVVGVAVMRDLFVGREMAKMMSLAMMVFTVFPAVAPLIGAGIIAVSGWRGIFLAFILFAIIMVSWMSLRLPETLPPSGRTPFRAPRLVAAMREVLRHPVVRLSILVQSLCLGMLFTMLSMVHQVYEVIFDRAASFPMWFAAIGLFSATASILNAALVERVGMRAMVTWSLIAQAVISFAMLAYGQIVPSGPELFFLFVFWQTSLFFMAGTTIGNLNAIAMEPMGHIAGMAASIMGGLSTVIAAMIAAPIGLMFNGSLVPLALGIGLMSAVGFVALLGLGRIENRAIV